MRTAWRVNRDALGTKLGHTHTRVLTETVCGLSSSLCRTNVNSVDTQLR